MWISWKWEYDVWQSQIICIAPYYATSSLERSDISLAMCLSTKVHTAMASVNTHYCSLVGFSGKFDNQLHTYRTNFRWLSICHRLFGAATWYERLATVRLHRLAAATGLVSVSTDRTRALWIRRPLARKYPDSIWKMQHATFPCCKSLTTFTSQHYLIMPIHWKRWLLWSTAWGCNCCMLGTASATDKGLLCIECRQPSVLRPAVYLNELGKPCSLCSVTEVTHCFNITVGKTLM